MTYALPPAVQPDASLPPPKPRHTVLIVGAACAIAVIAVLAVVIVAMIGGKTTAAGKASPSPSWSPMSWAPDTAQTATVRQYASAVSPPIKSLSETYQKYKDNPCALRTDNTGDLVCGLSALTFNAEAQTLSLTLTGATKRGVPAYIGEPPAEIRALVTNTIIAAQDLVTATAPGQTDSATMFSSLTELMAILDRWDPYL
jgi:hypothetical protein